MITTAPRLKSYFAPSKSRPRRAAACYFGGAKYDYLKLGYFGGAKYDYPKLDREATSTGTRGQSLYNGTLLWIPPPSRPKHVPANIAALTAIDQRGPT